MKAARAFGAKVGISPSHRALAAGRAALGTFVGAATALTILASAAAAADSRTIDLYNVHTKERLTIVFKKDGDTKSAYKCAYSGCGLDVP